MKSNHSHLDWIAATVAIIFSSHLNAQVASNSSTVNSLKAAQIAQESAGTSFNLPTLEEIRSQALWNAIDSIVKDYHYYITPDHLEKLLSIKITDREQLKDGRIISRYEEKVAHSEKVRNGEWATSTLSMQLENYTPSSYVPIWKEFQGWHKGAWFSILNISDSYSCRPLGQAEKDLIALGMKKESETTKLYGSVINENSIFVDPKYDAKVILYYTSPAVTNSCVSSVEIIGFGNLKVK